MAEDDGDLEIVRTDGGDWAVVRDGEQVSVHPNEAGAEAERTRISQADQGDPQPDAPYSPGEGPYPDNVGS